MTLDAPTISLAAVRAEKLARRIEAVRAQDSATIVKVILTDRSGRVLVLKDAASSYSDLPGGHLHAGEDPLAGLIREVYEETGLRLLAATYLREEKFSGGKTLYYKAQIDQKQPRLSEEHTGSAWVRRDELSQHNLGRHAPDVEAALAPKPDTSHHETARRAGEKIYDAAIAGWLAALGGDLMGATDQEAVYAAALGGWAPALETAQKQAYSAVARALGVRNPPAPDRSQALSSFPRTVLDSLRRAVADGEDPRALARRVHEILDKAPGARLAATEAQIAYGISQAEALAAAGYRRKRWVTVGDERVRDSHSRCEAQGAVPVNAPFGNGLMYPGDPNGPPEEVINCRCNLEGVDPVQAFDASKHPRGNPHNAGQFSNTPAFVFKNPVGLSDKLVVNLVSKLLNADQTVGSIELVKSGELPSFQQGGKTWQAAGYWHNDKKLLQSTTDPRVLAHEMGHAEFDYAKERALFSIDTAAKRHQDEHGEGAPLWQAGANTVKLLRADGSIHDPKTTGERMFNAILEFKNAHHSNDRLPTEYAKSWVPENIIDTMPATVTYKENTGNYENNLALELTTRRTLHEAYAEYSKGLVVKQLLSKGLLDHSDVVPSEIFKNMDGPEGRKAFLNLKAAIDDHAAARREGVRE